MTESPDLILSNKTCLITGATSGIGEVSARSLARLGAKVVITGRSLERCQAVVERIADENCDRPSCESAEFLVADLSEPAEVHRMACEFCERHTQLDVLINNVGAIYSSRQLTQAGFEATWSLNHLSYYLLTRLLLPVLKQTAAGHRDARVISVSSAAHRGAKIHWDDLQGERYYNAWRAYAQSKLANILFAFELDRRLRGTGVSSNVLHPGFVATGFGGNNPRWWRAAMNLAHRFAISPEEGAATTIYLASSPQVRGNSGLYFVNCRPTSADQAAYITQDARRLWEISEEMLGEYLK